MDRRGRRRRIGAVCAGLLALVLLQGISAFPAQEPDEGRYGDIAQEMVLSGDWVSPHLNGIRYYEKPPLYFWAAAAATRVLGFGERSVRLPSALGCLLAGLATLAWVGGALGRRRAWLTALALSSLPLFALLSHVAIVDGVLTLFTTLALVCGAKGICDPDPDEPASRRWILAAWAFAGLATLVKGPIGLVLPFSGLGLYCLVTRSWGRLRALLHPSGPLVLLAVAAPWYLVRGARDPGFLYEFFWEQNVQRLTTGGRFQRQAPLWFYVPVLVGSFLPWSLAIPAMVRRVRREGLRPRSRRGRVRLLLGLAVLAPFCVLSVAGSKLAYYLLPLCLPFAALAADAVWSARRARGGPRPVDRWGGRGLLVLAALLVLAGGAAATVAATADAGSVQKVIGRRAAAKPEKLQKEIERIGHAMRVWPIALPAVLLLACGFAAAGRRLFRGDRAGAMVRAAFGVTAVLLLTPYAMGRVGDAYSSKPVAEMIARARRPGDAVVSYECFVRGVPFYLREPIWLWQADHGEFGQAVRPDAEPRGRPLQRNAKRLRALLDSQRAVLVTGGAGDTRLLEALLGRPVRRVGRSSGREVVVTEPLPGAGAGAGTGTGTGTDASASTGTGTGPGGSRTGQTGEETPR